MTEAKSSNHSISGQSREMVPLSAEGDRFRLALQTSLGGFLFPHTVRDVAQYLPKSIALEVLVTTIAALLEHQGEHA